MRKFFRGLAMTTALFGLMVAHAVGQEGRDSKGPENMLGPNGRGVMGTVTAITPGGFTVKTADGESWKVTVGDNTRITHNREPASLKEIKPGSGVLAFGQSDAATPNTLHAVFASYQTPEEVKTRFAAFGKTWVAGKVTAIDGTKITITVQKPGESVPINLTFAVDETTDFKKGHEEITLADIKPGDYVMGKGAVKDGTFVPTELTMRHPGERRGPGEHHAPPEEAPPTP